MKLLAFDTATRTGVAIGSAGSVPRAFSVDLGKMDWPVRFSRTLIMTRKLIEEHKPDLVAVEQFVGGPKANSNLVGLVACVQGEATRLGVEVVSYYPATIRRHFLGGIRSKAPIKSQVMSKCRMLNWPSDDSDACDALALWDYALAAHSRSFQLASVGGLFVGQK